MREITTVLFDFGGVLVNLNKQRCIDEFKKLGVYQVENYISNYTQSGLFLALEKGLISDEEFRNEIRKLSNKTLSDQQIDTAWNSFLLDIPEYKLDLLLQLRKKYRVTMLSNTNSIHFEQKARYEFGKKGLSIDDYFDKCYLSYELGMAKPQEEIFNHVLENEPSKAHEILFLDDGILNIETAKRLGFTCYLAKEQEDFSPIFNTYL
ncbi:MAG: HAD family phosphatase [Paludibacteraceae bacterium]|nr:HAD family phosphatase [Paludibacteraceae bacterium]MBN2787303.1 HAD family phosphatase [Paludibacteraceae bacterium]